MSEPIWCEIAIAVPITWTNTLQHLTTWTDNIGHDYREIEPNEDAGFTEFMFQGDGNYGLEDDDFSAMLEWCVQLGLPYIASSQPKYDMSGELRVFNGTDCIDGDYSSEGPVLSHSTWEQIKAKRHGWATSVDVYFGALNRGLANMAPKHLLAFPDPTPVEQLDRILASDPNVDEDDFDFDPDFFEETWA